MEGISGQFEEGGTTIRVNDFLKRKSHSISLRWSLTIAGLILLVVVLILLANSLFLGRFYAHRNKSLFFEEFQEIKKNYSLSDMELLDLLREMDQRTGFLFYIAEIDDQQFRKVVLASVPNFTPEDPFGRTSNMLTRIDLPVEQVDFIMGHFQALRTGETVFGQIQRRKGNVTDSDLIFAAPLDPEHLLIITRPVEQLDEHTAITNQFLLIIGFITILIAIFLAQLSAKSVVRPIKEITEIAGHIAKLDFSHRYSGNDTEEIGTLGQSINQISTQLDSAMRELEEINERLQIEMRLQKRFFAGVSHEFKTPVGLIRGYAESLKLKLAKSPEEIDEFSDIILEETDRLNRLISDILLLVKSESVEFSMDMKVFDGIPLMERSVEEYGCLIKENKITLTKVLPQQIMIKGDEIRIRQIMDNLLSNAFRYCPSGGRISISAKNEKPWVKFSIENEGETIPDEHIDHLFEPFYSTSESRDKSITGTGLGLSIVKNLIEKHHGRCGIENIEEEGFKGVRVWFWLQGIE